MALTLGELRRKVLKLVDEYSINGKIVSENKNADYLMKINDLADMAQQELSQFRKIKARYDISQNILPNLIGSEPGNDIQRHFNEDINIEGVGAESYYFEADRNAKVYLEEFYNNSWQILKTIENNDSTGFKVFKESFVKFDKASTIRLRFSGNYTYSFRNIALYKYSFPTNEEVPEFNTMIKYKMPADFIELDKIVLESTNGQYEEMMNYYWETGNYLVLDYRYKGKVTIQYYRKPISITDNTSELYEFELDYTVANLIPYYVASIIIAPENPSLSNQYRRIYEVGLQNLEPQSQEGISVMQDINNW